MTLEQQLIAAKDAAERNLVCAVLLIGSILRRESELKQGSQTAIATVISRTRECEAILSAHEPAVLAFTDRLKRQGAAEELRWLIEVMKVAGMSKEFLDARAGQLEAE